MQNYELKEDEVVLFKGVGTLSDREGKTELMLTNLNIVFSTNYKTLFKKEELYVEARPITSLKVYEEIPQIKEKGQMIEMYFADTELDFVFDAKSDVHKFKDEVIKLFTGKSKSERNAEKVKNTIKLVDDTLGINSVELVGNVIKNGVVNSIKGAMKDVKAIGNIFKKKK